MNAFQPPFPVSRASSSSRARRPPLVVGFCLASALITSSGCATERAGQLPRRDQAESAEVDAAYKEARRLYGSCARDYEKNRFAWQIPTAAAAAAASAVSLGAAAMLPLFIVHGPIPDGQEASLTAVSAAGFGLVAVIAGGTATYFGAQAPAALVNEAALGDVLKRSETRINAAAEASDIAELREATRELVEDCRAVQIARDNTSSKDLLADLDRYREERKNETRRADKNAQSIATIEEQKRSVEGTLVLEKKAREEAETAHEEAIGRVRDLESRLGEREAENVKLHGRIFTLENELGAVDAASKTALDEQRAARAATQKLPELEKVFAEDLAAGRFVLRRRDEGAVLEIRAGALFEPGKKSLSTDGKKLLLKVAGVLRKLEDRVVRVEGHAAIPDEEGAPPTWSLTASRAVSVASFLQELGLDPSRLEVGARSHYAPVVPRNASEAKLRNERIELHLLLRSGDAERWRSPEASGDG